MASGPRAHALLALAIAPAALLVGFLVFPSVRVNDAAADAIAAAWACGSALVALALAARAEPPPRLRIALFLASAAVLAAIGATSRPGLAATVAAGGALVVASWALGDAVGRRIAHPGHVAPACAVAAAADVASVVAPEGPTHAIAASDAALPVLAIAGPVPGHAGMAAPTLGAGDLVFTALLLGAASRHGASRPRVAIAVATGIAAALALSASLGAPVPALPAIGVAVVALVPPFRQVRREDRRGSAVGIALALGLALAAVARRLLAG
jgi:hypothetical protein